MENLYHQNLVKLDPRRTCFNLPTSIQLVLAPNLGNNNNNINNNNYNNNNNNDNNNN